VQSVVDWIADEKDKIITAGADTVMLPFLKMNRKQRTLWIV